VQFVALEEEITRLYGLPLEDFTRERNEAARAARKAGRRDEAEAIGRLTKPSIAAWAVNQLARDQRREIDLLLDSGKRLLDAQRSSLEGQGRAELDQARESLDKAVASLVAGAKVLLEDRAGDATLGQIHETLRVAAVTPEGREELARGTLTKPLQGTGWDLLEGLAVDLPPGASTRAPGRKKRERPKKPGRTTKPEPPAPSQAELRAARAAVRDAKARRTDAARAVRDAERAHTEATQALDAATADLERAHRTLADAENDLAAAEKALRDRG
jgi:hypothetical protein